MNVPRLSSFSWLLALAAALAFLVCTDVTRIRRITAVSALGGWTAPTSSAVQDTGSLAADVAVGNGLILPEQLTESYHWIAQTQRMFLRGEWRVRHIDYENAPVGRVVLSASPYRWWLGFLAWCDHLLSGRPVVASVERAALVADPLLHLLLVLGMAALVAWRFGAFAAALLSLGAVTVFPFATAFLPGAPDDRGLASVLVLASVLLLLAGVGAPVAPTVAGSSARRWFILAGVAGGLGLWLRVAAEGPVLIGIGIGAVFAAWVARRSQGDGAAPSPSPSPLLPWRAWAFSGAVTTLAAYLLEFAPHHLGEWRLTAVHPLHALAWLGGGEIIAQSAEWIQGRKGERLVHRRITLALAMLAVVALPVITAQTPHDTAPSPELSSLRLTKLPESPVAPQTAAWIVRDGLSAFVWATFLPLGLIAPAGWLLFRREPARPAPVAVALALGPVLIAVALAVRQLGWWNEASGLLLLLIVAVSGTLPGGRNRPQTRIAWSAIVAGLLAPGIYLAKPRAQNVTELTQAEVLGLVERDLASWLRRHAGPTSPVLLAPPNETTALCYYGGMRGIGTLSWENRDGVAAAMRLLSASTPQEAKELIDARGITHLVTLSWDEYFDNFARAGTGQVEGTFRDQMKTWALPPWLRALSYPLPQIAGFEGRSVTIFEVVEDQDEATALGRMTEYFLETGHPEQAATVAQGLRRFPAHMGAWVARAEVELALADEAGLARSLKFLQSRLALNTTLPLPWDERVRLTVVLAKAKQMKLAREQLAVCVKTADAAKLRTLSSGSLYRLLVLSRALDLPLDPHSRNLALDLIPSDQRQRLR